MQVSSTYRPQNQLLPQGNLAATVPYTFSAKERDPETSLSYFGARYYSSDLSIWLSVDPMSDKYPNENPYVYCSNAPLLFKDPNGREKIIALDPSANQKLFNPIRRYTRNIGVIHFWGHGTESRIQVYDQEGEANKSYYSTSEFGKYLKKSSYIYNMNNQEEEESKTSILVLHSCKTGVKGGIGQDLSKELDLLVVAPSDDVEMKTLKDGSPEEKVSNGGVWNIYYKGELMESFNGKTKPLFDNPKNTIEKYENMYKERHPDGIESMTE